MNQASAYLGVPNLAAATEPRMLVDAEAVLYRILIPQRDAGEGSSNMASSEEIRRIIENEECACVFVDDTGSQGQMQGLRHMPNDRHTWVGLVVPPHMGAHVFEQMDGCLNLINSYADVEEFHFVDIYGGNGKWEDVDISVRLGIFSAFSSIVKRENFRIFNQTLWNDHKAVRYFSRRMPMICGKEMKHPKICSLVILMIKIRKFLEAQGWSNVMIVIDEGIEKAGAIKKCDGLWPTFRFGEIHFASSKEVSPLQLADLSAYALNRSQVIIGKHNTGKASWIDSEFMESIYPLLDCYDKVKKRIVTL